MVVRVPLEEVPFTRDKLIEVNYCGENKVYPCSVQFPAQWDRHFYYVLPDDFPECLIKVIFGAEAEKLIELTLSRRVVQPIAEKRNAKVKRIKNNKERPRKIELAF